MYALEIINNNSSKWFIEKYNIYVILNLAFVIVGTLNKSEIDYKFFFI